MKRKPILLEGISKRNKQGGREVIGLLGTHRGSGVTHTGLMLAFYLGVECGRKTAFLECNGHHDLAELQQAYEWKEESGERFSFQRITCYPEIVSEKIPAIYNEGYECIIMDFGTEFLKNREEFLRCDRKIVIGGKAEWEVSKLGSFYNKAKDIRGSDTWLYFIPRAGDKAISRIRTETNLLVWGIPVNDEPIVPSQITNRFFCSFF